MEVRDKCEFVLDFWVQGCYSLGMEEDEFLLQESQQSVCVSCGERIEGRLHFYGGEPCPSFTGGIHWVALSNLMTFCDYYGVHIPMDPLTYAVFEVSEA